MEFKIVLCSERYYYDIHNPNFPKSAVTVDLYKDDGKREYSNSYSMINRNYLFQGVKLTNTLKKDYNAKFFNEYSGKAIYFEEYNDAVKACELLSSILALQTISGLDEARQEASNDKAKSMLKRINKKYNAVKRFQGQLCYIKTSSANEKSNYASFQITTAVKVVIKEITLQDDKILFIASGTNIKIIYASIKVDGDIINIKNGPLTASIEIVGE
jgi:hypothetical protein